MQEAVFDTFPDLEHTDTWAEWEEKGTSSLLMCTQTSTSISLVKFLSGMKSHIYNTIIYPKTGLITLFWNGLDGVL